MIRVADVNDVNELAGLAFQMWDDNEPALKMDLL